MRTYLPRGSDWYDFWSNQRYRGGETVAREAPLDVVPLYVRVGAIVPMGPVLQYATERSDAPYDVRVYSGADGRFTLYEDDNETYAYEKGQSARYDLHWDDAKRTLAIGARRGTFPGLVKRRMLRVLVMERASDAAAPQPEARTVGYDGHALTLHFGKGT